MRLNHLSLPVRDLDEAEAFFNDDLDFKTLDRKGDVILTLDDGSDFILVLSTIKGGAGAVVAYPGDLHVGFFVDDREAVERSHARLAAAGHEVGDARLMRGRYGFYFTALGGLLFEISSAA